jgi:hypothetical protein
MDRALGPVPPPPKDERGGALPAADDGEDVVQRGGQFGSGRLWQLHRKRGVEGPSRDWMRALADVRRLAGLALLLALLYMLVRALLPWQEAAVGAGAPA